MHDNMDFQRLCHTYLQTINSTRESVYATPELSLLPHLKTFLENLSPDMTITQEPRKLGEIGRPDFIARRGEFPIGYIEAEAYGTALDALTGHAKAQNQRFIENLDNFILTNFVEFRLYTDGTLRAKASLSGPEAECETLLNRFFSATPVPLATPAALANYLARRTRELQTQIAAALKDEASDIYQIFSAFQKLLLATLTPADFADMSAQTLAYGLFAARCTLPTATHFSRITAAAALPKSNPFLQSLFHQVAQPRLHNNITWILDDIARLLGNVSTEMLRTAFDVQTHASYEGANPPSSERSLLLDADPVIHFYETFLAAYDAHRRTARGVYYTPPPVISYIVRSVDALLKTKLQKPDGLADTDALILDPATGTGGFLLAVLNHIRQHVTDKYGSGVWGHYIREHLVQQVCGFEILVAPYTIAHLTLSLFLQANGWAPTGDERLSIYLTNTLAAPIEKERFAFAGFISDEANAAVSVKKDAPVLAIIGNPPYTEASTNPSRVKGKLTFIGRLIEDYKKVDGERLKTRGALQADYVKFIRWAQWRVEQTGEGVIGYIVNNGFLDGTDFSGMRQSLLNSFNALYLFNLHGSSIIKEAIPTEKKDENVFNIQQGVSILLCVKERDNADLAKVFYADLWGSRAEKYQTLSDSDVQNTQWTELHPTSSLYLFVPQDTARRAEYEEGLKVTDIFQVHSAGVITARDKFTIHHTPEAVRDVVTDFVSLSEEEARGRYQLRRDTTSWQIAAAQADLRNHPDTENHIVPIRYRPFDTRFTYYTGKSKGFHNTPSYKTMRHLLLENLALCVCFGVPSPAWKHVLVTAQVTVNSCLSTRGNEGAHVFPLYLYPVREELELASERSLNFKPAFLEAFSVKLGLPQAAPFGTPTGVSPEAILGYLYAVLHSPVYRKRYYDFLKYDFPRIPMPTTVDVFRKLSALGCALIDMHLLRNVPTQTARHRFEGEGDSVVAKYGYRDGKVWINQIQHFADVPADVWEFEIGAYQVCDRWLKERKHTPLSLSEIRQYQQLLVAVAETLRLMAEIGQFPI